ncbi:MAG: class I mannose-6-phosphate isomerase [bacterium]|nr:class I mannose-6-phosphate isomerase [bacterium]
MDIYPIKTAIIPKERVWGAFKAEELGRSDLRGPVGELWIIGGNQAIVNGRFAGLTLDELSNQESGLLGESRSSFPLLVKKIKTSSWLSVQVHPDDNTAKRLTGSTDACGKTECWYVTEAEPGAELISGFTGTFSELWQNKKFCPERLQHHAVKSGDFFFIDAGTVHSLGPGISLYEFQQNCDITYRLYDWDRLGIDGKSRPLHILEAEAAIQGAHAISQLKHKPAREVIGHELCDCPYFALGYAASSAAISWSPKSAEIILLLSGMTDIILDGRVERLATGDACVIPRAAKEVKITPSENISFLRAEIF